LWRLGFVLSGGVRIVEEGEEALSAGDAGLWCEVFCE